MSLSTKPGSGVNQANATSPGRAPARLLSRRAAVAVLRGADRRAGSARSRMGSAPLELQGLRDLEPGDPVHAGDQTGVDERAVGRADRFAGLSRRCGAERVQARFLPRADQVELGRSRTGDGARAGVGDGDAAVRLGHALERLETARLKRSIAAMMGQLQLLGAHELLGDPRVAAVAPRNRPAQEVDRRGQSGDRRW